MGEEPAKEAEEWVHQAYSEWAKEIGGGRKYDFTGRYSDGIYWKADFEKLKKLTDKYLKDIKKLIKKTAPVK